ncbi:MAG: protein kinase domain-containing protein [Planctomycetota bacterium]|jgi:tetratricopeptide (TPR) repeat protein/tRNA A-37 threonylcarbamoyl transferase component Bud32
MSSESKGPKAPDEKPEAATTVTYRQVVPQVRAGRYSVQQFHARGGIGEVWLAEDREINRQVALKKLRPDHRDSQDRFIAEAQITGQLEHPAIVPVHDFGLDEEGQPFYVMKFVRGRTLKRAIEEYHSKDGASRSDREVEWLRLLQVFVDLCQAVAFAHGHGVLHRDLKPDNVMLGPYGETLLLDWGLAKVLSQPEEEAPGGPSYVRVTRSDGSTDTQAGSVLGAPSYMAPEVAEGRASEVDQTTDVYLLGATLYEILTGNPPRKGTSHAEIVELARTVEPVPPRERNRAVPRLLEAICLKAMARRKDDRYQTAHALAGDVQRYLAGEPVSAYREGILARTWRWAKRHRRGLGRSAAAALLAGLALFGFAKLREAEAMQAQEDARRQVADFRDLADEIRFYAASTNPPDVRAPYYDPGKAETAAQAALGISQNWGPALEELPLSDSRDLLKQELYELLLLRVQAKQGPSLDPQQAQELLAVLEQARSFSDPTRSYYRLQSELFRLLEDEARASQALQRAEDPVTRTTALDHFLRGEEYRMQTALPSDAKQGGASQERNRALLEHALAEYGAALQVAPDHYWSHFQSGRCRLALGRGAEAVESLTTCVALRPEVPWGHSARGLTLAFLGRFSEAERDLELAVKQHDGFRPAQLNRGVAFWLQRKHKLALADFEAVLRPPAGERLIEAAFYRAKVYLEQGDYAKAVQDLDRVIEEKSEFGPAYADRAKAHLLLGEETAALDDLSKVVGLSEGGDFDPESPQSYEERGRRLRRLSYELPKTTRTRVLELAHQQLEKADELGKPSADLLDELGAVRHLLVRYRLKRLPEAIEIYSRGLELEPTHVELRLKRGAALAEQSPPDYQQAAADYAEVLRHEPDHENAAEAHVQLGYLHACLNDPIAAREHATKALMRGAGDYFVLHHVACIYAELSKSGDRQATEHADLAMVMIHREVELWKRGGGPNALELIRNEPAFSPLRDRPDFKRLFEDSNRKN